MNSLSYIVVEISLTIKCGEEEKRAYTRKNKLENDASQSHDTTCRCLLVYKIWTCYLKWFWSYLWRNIAVLITRRERKDNKYKEEQTKPVIYPTIQLVIVILNIKYGFSILYSCGDIVGEKWREKEKWINIGKNKQENAGSQSHDTTCCCLPVTQIWTFYLKWFWRYLWRENAVLMQYWLHGEKKR